MPPGDEKTGDGTKGSSKDGRDQKDGGGSNKKRFSPQKTATGPRFTKFEGRCEELKGHIYDCSNAKNLTSSSRLRKKSHCTSAGRTLTVAISR